MSRSRVLALAVLVCVAVCLWVPAEASAQGGFGLKGGVNFATLRGDLIDTIVDGSEVNLLEFKNGTGFTGGVFFAIPLGPGFVIQPEALYQTRISKIEFGALGEIEGIEFDASVKADYIEVPVLLKWQPGSGGVRPMLYAGPSIAFRLAAEIRAQAMGQSETEDIKDDIKSTDFGLVFGAGLNFGMFGVEARYNLGLTNAVANPGNGVGADSDLKWGMFSLMANLTF